MLASWAAAYVGIPWQDGGRTRKGCDCWGLLRLVYQDIFGVDLPSHVGEYRSAADATELAAVLRAHLSEPASAWRPVHDSRVGDALLFRVDGQPAHVGVYVGDGEFLHVRRSADACCERLQAPLWARRCLGAYRHASVA